jgi:hypothetical protein
MAEFAGRYDTPAAQDLLVQVADTRIARYANWTVEYELVDGVILQQLCDKIVAADTPEAELSRRFAQLYSFVIERYIKGQRLDVLKESSKSYLIAVLVQTEQNCLGKLLAAPQATITRLVAADDLVGLQAEHDRLFGAPDQMGVLPARLDFDYGADRSAPVTLPDPPRQSAQS